jgi:hypothetical protein
VGWSMQPEMHSNLVIDALEMAWLRRSPDRNADLSSIVTAAASTPAMSSAPAGEMRHHRFDEPQGQLLG